MSGLRVVLDSNVYISAFLFGGHPQAIMERIVSGQLSGAVSVPILDEVREVLGRTKFGLSDEAIVAFMAELQDLCEIVSPTKRVKVIKDDPDDDRILECALAANAAVIVSGDSHLLALSEWRGIPVRSPASFVKEL